MKKKFLFALCALIVALGLAGCSINAETTISFSQNPKATYTLPADTYDLFMEGVKVKVGSGAAVQEYTLKNILSVQGVTVTLDGVAIAADKWVKGSHTLVVTFETVHCDFNFTITDGSGDGDETIKKVDPSYTWYTVAATEYTLTTVGDLVGFANIVNGLAEGIVQSDFKGKTVKLAGDIDLTNVAWTPIGQGPRKFSSFVTARSLSNVKNVFRGTFDGQNFTVKGLSNKAYQPVIVADSTYVNSSGTILRGYTFGLFGRAENAVIKNLKMTKVSIAGEISFDGKAYSGDSVAAVLGYSWGDLTLENIQVGAEGDIAAISGYDSIGGICGRIAGSDSKKAADTKTIIVKNCNAYANVTCVAVSERKAAGLVGCTYNNSLCNFTNCYYKGTVTTAYTNNAVLANEKLFTATQGRSSVLDAQCKSDGTLVVLTPAA